MLGIHKLFLTLRVNFKLSVGNPLQVSFYFMQVFANVMNGKLSLREDDYLNLAALKLCS